METLHALANDLDRNQIIIGSCVALVTLVGVSKLLNRGDDGYKKLLAQRKEVQTVEVGPAKPGEGAPRRGVRFKDKLLDVYDPEITTLYELWNKTAAKYPNRACLGTRRKEGETVGPYEWVTYQQVVQQRDALGSGLVNLGHQKGDPIGIYSVNRAEWVVVDAACQAFNFPSVALYDTLGQNAVEFIVKHAEIKIVVCAGKQFNNVLAAARNCDTLSTIICMDPISQEMVAQAKDAQIKLLYIKDVEADGVKNPREHSPPSPVDIYTIMYTSGTTGDPKGVLLSHGNLIAELTGIRNHEEGLFSCNDIHMSYLPLAHSFERAVVLVIISYGAGIGFYQGNIIDLFNDIATLRPTFLVGAPRVWSRLYDKLTLAIDTGSPIKKKLFHWGYAAKKAALEKGATTPFWDKILFSKTKARIGGRVRFILSGSAPLDPKLGEFLKICFCCNVLEGYGLTENAAGAFITRLNETQLGHVGTPLCCIEAKLVDVAEMGYTSSHDPPTGEVVIRGGNIFRGYFKEKDKTTEVLEPDGWFHTGDIGRWNPVTGTLSIIDRKKNIFKLAQGEYVAVEYLESVYMRSKFAQQIWVYGNSYKRYLIAFVVPDPDVVLPWAKENSFGDSLQAICESPKAEKAILDDLISTGNEAKLHGFEFIKAIRLISEPFSVDNEQMTPTFKLRRANLLNSFKGIIEELYQKIEP